MLKQVGSVVVAGLVGAMSYSAQGETPNPLIPIVFAGGAFLGATVLFNKLEPDLSVPVVAAAPVSSSSNTYESGKKKGKKATKQAVVKKEEPKVVAASLSSDDEVDGDDEEVAPVVKKVDKKKKKSGGAKKEEKKAATAAPAVAEKKATKDAPKKAAAKKEEKKAAPAPAVVKKDEKKDAKKDGKKAAPATAAATVAVAKKDEKKDGKKKKSGAKKEEKKATPAAPLVASATSDDDEDGGWEVVRKQRPVKEKDTSAKGDGEAKEEVKEKKFDSTIRIPSDKYGAIIGTKGETLQQLEKKTGAKITIPKEGEIVNVWGTVEQVKNAKLALQEFAEKGWSRATHQGWEDSDFKYANEKDIAKILGVGGVNIKKFQSEFKVIINTPKEGSLERVITINGERDNVRQCKAAIKDLLQLGYSPLVYPDFITRTIPVTKKELLAVMGKGGCNVKHIQKTTGIYAINTPKKEEQAAEIAVTLIGYPAQVDKADSMVRTYLAPEEPAAPSSEWEEGAGGFNEETAWD